MVDPKDELQEASRALIRAPGPKPVEVRPGVIASFSMMMCSVPEIASFIGMSERQLYRRMAKEPELRQAYNEGRNRRRRMIRRWQWESAEQGSVKMRKWLGKQYLGQGS